MDELGDKDVAVGGRRIDVVEDLMVKEGVHGGHCVLAVENGDNGGVTQILSVKRLSRWGFKTR